MLPWKGLDWFEVEEGKEGKKITINLNFLNFAQD